MKCSTASVRRLIDGTQELVWHEVTPEMGKVSFQGPSCSKPLKKVAGITAFFKSPGAGGKTGAHIVTWMQWKVASYCRVLSAAHCACRTDFLGNLQC
jgi:hypothetical protein